MSDFKDSIARWVKENPLGAKVIEQEARIDQLERELEVEKALADRLYEAGRNHRVSSFHARDKSFIDAHRAYRKARGL